MGKASRDKGARREREIVHLHLDVGIHAERVPLSGAMRYQEHGHDVDIYPFGKDSAPLCCEVKAKNGEATGWKLLDRWLGENDALFLVRDRTPPLVVLPWHVYVKLANR